jgi:ankyrin repeat protein
MMDRVASGHGVDGVGVVTTSDSGRLLRAAAVAGDLSRLDNLHSSGADLNARDASGQTALIAAASAGQTTAVAYLLLAGANELERDRDGKTALMHAVEQGHADVVQLLLDMETAHYDEQVQFRLTRMVPKLAKSVDFSRLRFEAGRNLVDEAGESPLMKAADRGNLKIFDSLMLFSDDTLRDKQGRTALMHAVEQRQDELLSAQLEGARAWLERIGPGSGIAGFIRPETLAIPDHAGRTPLQRAEQLGLQQTADGIRSYLQSVIERSTRLLEASDKNAPALYQQRSQAYRALGETEKADADFRQSREMSPQ